MMRCACARRLEGWQKSIAALAARWRSKEAAARMRDSMLGAFLFCMAAHAFAYFNFVPLHDGANYVTHLAGQWEVSLGRFLQPLYGSIRGEYTMPWLSGMLCMLYIGVAAFLIADLFDIRDRLAVMLSAGFLVVNATMTNLTMVFTYVLDVFALAMLLACAGAYMVIRLPNLPGALLGACLLAASMGLYQSYVLCGVELLVLYAMGRAASERRLLKSEAAHWLRYIASLLLAAVIYALLYRRFLRSYGTQMASASSYNSPAKLAALSLTELAPMFAQAYASAGEYFFGIGVNAGLSAFQAGNAALAAMAAVLLLAYAWRERLPLFNGLIIALGILVFPGIALVMSVLSQHSRLYFLTAHALFLMYPALLALISKIRVGRQAVPLFERSRALRACTILVCGCILFSGIRFSNSMYTFEAVQYDKTLSYVTRLMTLIDGTPGYERNETEVVFVGYSSAGLSNVNEPEGWEWMEGMNSSAVTYLQVLRSFIHNLGEQMNIPLDYSGLPDYAAMQEVQAMPAFPDPACCRMIDGMLLVKLTGD